MSRRVITEGLAATPENMNARYVGSYVVGGGAHDVEGDGTTDDRTALHTLANTTLSGVDATIDFTEGTYLVNSDLTIPSNIRLRFANGAKIKPASGVTLTISGAFVDPGNVQVFEGEGEVVFGAGTVLEFRPEWWGLTVVAPDATAPTSAVMSQNVAAMQACIDAAEAVRGRVVLPDGDIWYDDQIMSIESAIHVKGAGFGQTAFRPASTYEGFAVEINDCWRASGEDHASQVTLQRSLSKARVVIEDVMFIGRRDQICRGLRTWGRVDLLTLRNVQFSHFHGHAIQLAAVGENTDTAGKPRALLRESWMNQVSVGSSGRMADLTGTVACTNGSNTVTGTGTAFENELIEGCTLIVRGAGVGHEYMVESIESDTSLTLRSPNGFQGTTGSYSATAHEAALQITTNGYATDQTNQVWLQGLRIVHPFATGLQIWNDSDQLLRRIYFDSPMIHGLNNKEEAPAADLVQIKGRVHAVRMGDVRWNGSTRQTLTGTVAVENGSDTVTGTGTEFESEVEVGQLIDINGVAVYVESIESDTSLTLSDGWSDSTASGLTASIRYAVCRISPTSDDGSEPTFCHIEYDLRGCQGHGIIVEAATALRLVAEVQAASIGATEEIEEGLGGNEVRFEKDSISGEAIYDSLGAGTRSIYIDPSVVDQVRVGPSDAALLAAGATPSGKPFVVEGWYYENPAQNISLASATTFSRLPSGVPSGLLPYAFLVPRDSYLQDIWIWSSEALTAGTCVVTAYASTDNGSSWTVVAREVGAQAGQNFSASLNTANTRYRSLTNFAAMDAGTLIALRIFTSADFEPDAQMDVRAGISLLMTEGET